MGNRSNGKISVGPNDDFEKETKAKYKYLQKEMAMDEIEKERGTV